MKNTLTNTFTAKHVITAVALITFGVAGRMLLIDFPNIETVMAVSIISGALLGPHYGLLVALFTVMGSDVLIGNTNIFLYTWAAWIVIGATSHLVKRNKAETAVWSDALKLTGFGLAGTVFFFLVTNFGVWHLSGLYAPTVAGLVESYVMAIPFLRNQLLGNMVIVPAVSLVALTAWKYVPSLAAAMTASVRSKANRGNRFTV